MGPISSSPIDNTAAALSAAAALAGLLGAAVHASLLYTPQPPAGGGGSALNVLLASLTLFFGVEALWAQAGGAPLASGPFASRCRRVCTAVPLAATPLIAILLAVGFRPDSAAWCVPLLIALVCGARAAARGSAARAAAKNPHAALGESLVNNSDAAPVPPPQEPPLSAAGACRACCCPPRGAPLRARAGFFAHALAWGAAVATLTLLLGGAGTIASGWRRYPRRGRQYDLRPLGVPALVHAWCSGPPASPAQATIWLDFGGGGHSSSDALGLQFALNAAGRRVCTHDVPGTAWSPLLQPADEVDGNSAARQRALITAMGERGPFVLVGSMDGGAERIYAFALAHPELTAALVPMQYGVAEFTGWAAARGLAPADPAVLKYAAAQIAARVGFCDAIRFLGTSWGLVPLFAPRSPRFVPLELQDECHFLNLFHEGQWDMQCRLLAAQVARPASIMAPSLWQTNRSLARAIPVLSVGNFPADACAASGAAPGSEDCAVQRLTYAINADFMRNMSAMTPRSAFVNGCASDGSDVCKDWMGGGATVAFLVPVLLGFLRNASL